MARTVLLFCLVIFVSTVAPCKVSLTNNGPAVRGSNITFTATLSQSCIGENLKYVFMDSSGYTNDAEFMSTTGVVNWTVEYKRNLYVARQYTAEVHVKRLYNIINMYIEIARASTDFTLTDTLHGGLVLKQNNVIRPNTFVAVNETVHHYIELPQAEMDFLKANASQVLTYWFIDCKYIDQTTTMSLDNTYRDTMSEHNIDVLVVANNDPLPPITTTTTTTTTTSTTTTTTTTTTEKSSEVIPAHNITKRAAKKKSPVKDFICRDTVVPIGDHYTYGHYQATLKVREPISKINITGRNWLQHGDLLNLEVKYTGSPPFDFCAQYKKGEYNITGNETCSITTRTVVNTFPLVRYFLDSDQHTVVVIIENEMGRNVSRATINIYKALVHAQLSVIVVPVAFCLLAVILVVFGVAYYQHRSKYTIEVADFDFGQQANLDYKTFRERLRDSFRSALNLRHDSETDPLTPNSRYDS